MDWNRIDITEITVELEQLVAAVQDTKFPPSTATVLARASAVLSHARALPELVSDDGTGSIASGWQCTHYVAEDGMVEISCWKQEASVLFQSEWQDNQPHSVLVQIGERVWMRDTAYPQGWSFDSNAPLEIFGQADEMAEVREKAEKIVARWEEKQHPKQGWICSQCGWQNPADAAVCVVCQVSAGATLPSPWTGHGDTPPHAFATASGSDCRRDGRVELDMPMEIEELVNQLGGQVKDELTEKMRNKSRDVLKGKEQQQTQCWYCKTELRPNARYCDKCGADQQAAPSAFSV